MSLPRGSQRTLHGPKVSQKNPPPPLRPSPRSLGPSPTVEDMSQVLMFLQLWHAVEPYKAYPREQWVLGRVRVRLLDEDGVPWNPEVPDRE